MSKGRLLHAAVAALEKADGPLSLRQLRSICGNPPREHMKMTMKSACKNGDAIPLNSQLFVHPSKIEAPDQILLKALTDKPAGTVELKERFPTFNLDDLLPRMKKKGHINNINGKWTVMTEDDSTADFEAIMPRIQEETPEPAAVEPVEFTQEEVTVTPVEAPKSTHSGAWKPTKARSRDLLKAPFVPGSEIAELYELIYKAYPGAVSIAMMKQVTSLSEDSLRRQISHMVENRYAKLDSPSSYVACLPEDPTKTGPLRARILYMVDVGDVFEVASLAAIFEMKEISVRRALEKMPEMQCLRSGVWTRIDPEKEQQEPTPRPPFPVPKGPPPKSIRVRTINFSKPVEIQDQPLTPKTPAMQGEPAVVNEVPKPDKQSSVSRRPTLQAVIEDLKTIAADGLKTSIKLAELLYPILAEIETAHEGLSGLLGRLPSSTEEQRSRMDLYRALQTYLQHNNNNNNKEVG